MSDERDSTQRYEAVPASMVCPAFPQLTTDSLFGVASQAGGGRNGLSGLQERGWKAFAGNIQAADARTRALIEECRRRIDAKEVGALVELLNLYPALVEHEWVRAALCELARTGEFKRPRGRPPSRYKVHPLVVIAMVEALIRAGEVAYLEKALFVLDGWGVLSYDNAKRLYHAGLREPRFKPIFITFEAHKREISREEVERLTAGANSLESGQVRYPIEDPVRGKGELVLGAVD